VFAGGDVSGDVQNSPPASLDPARNRTVRITVEIHQYREQKKETCDVLLNILKRNITYVIRTYYFICVRTTVSVLRVLRSESFEYFIIGVKFNDANVCVHWALGAAFYRLTRVKCSATATNTKKIRSRAFFRAARVKTVIAGRSHLYNTKKTSSFERCARRVIINNNTAVKIIAWIS